MLCFCLFTFYTIKPLHENYIQRKYILLLSCEPFWPSEANMSQLGQY